MHPCPPGQEIQGSYSQKGVEHWICKDFRQDRPRKPDPSDDRRRRIDRELEEDARRHERNMERRRQRELDAQLEEQHQQDALDRLYEREREQERKENREAARREEQRKKERDALPNPWKADSRDNANSNPWTEDCRRQNPTGNPFNVSVACEEAAKWDRNEAPGAKKQQAVNRYGGNEPSIPKSNQADDEDQNPFRAQERMLPSVVRELIEAPFDDCRSSNTADLDAADLQLAAVKNFLIDQSTGFEDSLLGLLADVYARKKSMRSNSFTVDSIFRLTGVAAIFGTDEVICRIYSR